MYFNWMLREVIFKCHFRKSPAHTKFLWDERTWCVQETGPRSWWAGGWPAGGRGGRGVGEGVAEEETGRAKQG